MPAASLIDSQSPSNYTYLQFVNALKQALINAGMPATLHDDQSANTTRRYMVWKVQVHPNTSDARAYVYYRIRIVSTAGVYKIEQRWYYNWNAVTFTGTVFTNVTTANIDVPQNGGGQPVKFTSILHPELKGVIINHGSLYGFVGLFMPANKVPGWGFDGIQYACAFIGNTSLGLQEFYQPDPNGYDDNNNYVNQFALNPTPQDSTNLSGNGTFYALSFYDYVLRYRKSGTLKNQLIPRPMIGAYSQEGIAAFFSDDFVIASGNDLTWFTKLTDGTRNYMVVVPRSVNSSSTPSSLAIAI